MAGRTVSDIQKIEILGEARSRDDDTLRNEDATKLYLRGTTPGKPDSLEVETGLLSVRITGTDAAGKPAQDIGKVRILGTSLRDQGVFTHFSSAQMALVDSEGKTTRVNIPKPHELKFADTGNIATDMIPFDLAHNREQIAGMIKNTLDAHKDLRLAVNQQQPDKKGLSGPMQNAIAQANDPGYQPPKTENETLAPVRLTVPTVITNAPGRTK